MGKLGAYYGIALAAAAWAAEPARSSARLAGAGPRRDPDAARQNRRTRLRRKAEKRALKARRRER